LKDVLRPLTAPDTEGSDLAWLFAAVPIAAFLAWLVVVTQR
jgi:hypothetical protein